jgi:hypothetical protein
MEAKPMDRSQPRFANPRRLSPWVRLALALLAPLAIGGVAAAQTNGYAFPMTGVQEVPPVLTAAMCRTIVALDLATGDVRVNGIYSGLSGSATAAHIHAAPAGVNGPILVPLTVSGTTSGIFSGSGTLASSDVVALSSGLLYVNLHSTVHPGGELRGQIRGPANVFVFGLDPGQEVPAVASGATGTGTVVLDDIGDRLIVYGTYSGLTTDATLAHIHSAPAGTNGGILLTLSLTGTTSGTFSGAGSLTAAQVTELLCEEKYVNVHTSTFPAGEIRGQILATPTATVYGSGINPAGSMTVVGGTPSISTRIVLGVDNPLGTQSVGSFALLFLATAQDALFGGIGVGTPIPGFGMSAPGAPGELLVSLAPPNPVPPVGVGGPWVGPGSPVAFNIMIPNNKALHGRTFYAQGLLFDPSVALGIKFGLTDAVAMTIGL